MKVVYIAHPISGDIEGNLSKIRDIVRAIALHQPDIVPFVPYYVDIVSLDDNDPVQRKRGISNDIELFKRKVMDEVWLFGDKLSKGMKAEVELAFSLGIPVIIKSGKINLDEVFDSQETG